MRKMIATYPFTYGRKSLEPGDLFEADSDEDARLLCGFGKARVYKTAVYPAVYKTAAMTGDPKKQDYVTSEVSNPENRKKKWQNRYNRSDMRAND